LKTKDRAPKTNRNEPKNEAEKLLKIRSCGKNEPKNEPTDVVENIGRQKLSRGHAFAELASDRHCLLPSKRGVLDRKKIQKL
jgi:hypothetical protein